MIFDLIVHPSGNPKYLYLGADFYFCHNAYIVECAIHDFTEVEATIITLPKIDTNYTKTKIDFNEFLDLISPIFPAMMSYQAMEFLWFKSIEIVNEFAIWSVQNYMYDVTPLYYFKNILNNMFEHSSKYSEGMIESNTLERLEDTIFDSIDFSRTTSYAP